MKKLEQATTDIIKSREYYYIPPDIYPKRIEVFNGKTNKWYNCKFDIYIKIQRKELKNNKTIKMYYNKLTNHNAST